MPHALESGRPGQQFESVNVRWPNDSEVSFIQSGDRRLIQPLGNRNDRGVSSVEANIAVRADKFGDPRPVDRSERFDHKLSRGDRVIQQRLGALIELAPNQPSSFSDDQTCSDKRPGMRLKQLTATLMSRVSRVCCGNYRSSINDQHCRRRTRPLRATPQLQPRYDQK